MNVTHQILTDRLPCDQFLNSHKTMGDFFTRLISSEPVPLLTLVVNVIGLVFLGLAAALAVRQLRLMAHAAHLNGFDRFVKLLAETRGDREWVYQHMPIAEEELQALSTEDRLRIERVLTTLNEVALMLERGLVPKWYVLSLCHTLIIRSWWKARHYQLLHASRIGGRYGARIEHMVKRALLYHELSPLQRNQRIKLWNGVTDEILVDPPILGAFKTMLNRLRWWLQIY